jgi:hypothetical protein
MRKLAAAGGLVLVAGLVTVVLAPRYLTSAPPAPAGQDALRQVTPSDPPNARQGPGPSAVKEPEPQTSSDTTETQPKPRPAAAREHRAAEAPRQSPHDPAEPQDDLVREVYGEPIPVRIARFVEHSTFPFAERIAVPRTRIFPKDAVGGPVTNRMLSQILNDAFLQSASGQPMHGNYEDPHADASVGWRMSETAIDEVQEGLVDEQEQPIRLVKEYRLHLDGHIADESFENWLYTILKVDESGRYVSAVCLTPDGGFNGRIQHMRFPLEDVVKNLQKHENGIERAKWLEVMGVESGP